MAGRLKIEERERLKEKLERLVKSLGIEKEEAHGYIGIVRLNNVRLRISRQSIEFLDVLEHIKKKCCKGVSERKNVEITGLEMDSYINLYLRNLKLKGIDIKIEQTNYNRYEMVVSYDRKSGKIGNLTKRRILGLVAFIDYLTRREKDDKSYD